MEPTVTQNPGHHQDGFALPFLLGTLVGGIAGAVAGTFLSGQTTHLVSAIADMVDRRPSSDREKLRFELLLQ